MLVPMQLLIQVLTYPTEVKAVVEIIKAHVKYNKYSPIQQTVQFKFNGDSEKLFRKLFGKVAIGNNVYLSITTDLVGVKNTLILIKVLFKRLSL